MSALLHALLAAPFGQLSSLFGSASAPNPPPPSGLMDTFASLADDCHLSADGLIITLVLAGLFANHFWRIVCFVLALRLGFPAIAAYTDDSCPITYPYTFWTIVYAACMCATQARPAPPRPPMPHAAPTTARPRRRYAPLLPFMNWRHVRQPVAGAVFVTGADSGMGQWTATRLASAGFRVYAGCFAPNSDKELKAKARGEGGEAAASNVIIVPLDVTKDESVSAAAARVAKDEAKAPNGGLVGVINCAGMGFNGPAEYFPLAMLKQQMEVNFIGYVRVVQDSAARALMCRPPVARSRTARPKPTRAPHPPLPPRRRSYPRSRLRPPSRARAAVASSSSAPAAASCRPRRRCSARTWRRSGRSKRIARRCGWRCR